MTTTPLHAPLQWAQRSGVVLVTVGLQDASNVVLRLVADTLSLSCSSEGKVYTCETLLFAAVSAEESSFVARPRHIEIRIQKKDSGWWTRLTKDKGKNAHITLDWTRWQDEDDIDDNDGDLGDIGDFGMGEVGDMDEEELRRNLKESGDKVPMRALAGRRMICLS